MTVGERKVSFMAREAAKRDQFPVGMRVLAVDDDPVCLKLLEALLIRCKYQVTTTNQAMTALNLLRENKDKFDLVISDVHMPDMDGFKLLELVGLEMDLPVIMLSVNGETKTVMKGITHGACDYLLKPVRIEELRNIWQHVVRRRKLDHTNLNTHYNRDVLVNIQQNANCESGQGSNVNGSSDHICKFSKKRKEQNDEDEYEDEDDGEENIQEDEDPSSLKKPRVVWSIELHRKFVAAVNQLGIDKAVPKRILELMNDEKLTRENVASHLQKYRLYLKRLSAVASQQANMVAALGARDTSFMQMGSLDGFGGFHALSGSGQLPALATLQPTGVFNTTNTISFGHHSLSSSVVQVGHNSTGFPIMDKLPQINVPTVQHRDLLQGIPTSFELEQIQKRNAQEANIHLPGGFSFSALPTGSFGSSFIDTTNRPLASQAYIQQSQPKESYNCSSAPGSFRAAVGISSNLADLNRCNDTWQGAVQLSGYITDALSRGSSTNHNHLVKSAPSNFAPQRDNDSLSNSCRGVVPAPQLDSLIGRSRLCEANPFNRDASVMPVATDGNSKLINFSFASCSKQKQEKPKQDNMHGLDTLYNSFQTSNSSSSYLIDPILGNQSMSARHLHKDMLSTRNASSSALMERSKVNNAVADGLLKYKGEYILEMPKLKSAISPNVCILDELVGSMIKPERDDTIFMESDIGCDFYPLSACM